MIMPPRIASEGLVRGGGAALFSSG